MLLGVRAGCPCCGLPGPNGDCVGPFGLPEPFRRAVAGRERIARWHTVTDCGSAHSVHPVARRLVLAHAHAIWHVLRIVLCLVRQSGLLCVRRTLLWGRRDARRLLLGCRRVRTILWCQAVRFRFAVPSTEVELDVLALLGGGTGNRRRTEVGCSSAGAAGAVFKSSVFAPMLASVWCSSEGACVLVGVPVGRIIVVVSHRLSLYVSS